jgi:hypothetical protein
MKDMKGLIDAFEASGAPHQDAKRMIEEAPAGDTWRATLEFVSSSHFSCC